MLQNVCVRLPGARLLSDAASEASPLMLTAAALPGCLLAQQSAIPAPSPATMPLMLLSVTRAFSACKMYVIHARRCGLLWWQP